MTYVEPEYAPWDGRRVPLTFVAGYLGAGKTTLINELLATADRPIAVMVNDVGEVNIDARLIKRRHGDTIELTDGCVCCSLSEGFGIAFNQIRAREEPPDHIVVELSGVAEPSRVLPWSKSAGFKLDGVVTVVDSEQFLDRIEGDEVTAHTMRVQLEAADLVVLTKLDLLTGDQGAETEADIRTMIDEITSGAPIITGDTASLASLLSIGGRRPGGITTLPTPSLFDRHETSIVEIPNPIDRMDLKKLLDALPNRVVRAKGIGIDENGARWLAEVIGRRRWVTELPHAEAEPPTDLVVISLPAD